MNMNVRTTEYGEVHAQDENGSLLCTPNITGLWPTREDVTCRACVKLKGRTPKYNHDLRPGVNAFMDSTTGEIFISAYESDDPMWEANHVILKDARGSKHESVLNILSNVLQQAGVRLVIE